MKILAILAIFAIFATSCAPIHISIIEGAAQGGGLINNAKVGSCSVSIRGELPDSLIIKYNGEKCQVEKQ